MRTDTSIVVRPTECVVHQLGDKDRHSQNVVHQLGPREIKTGRLQDSQNVWYTTSTLFHVKKMDD